MRDEGVHLTLHVFLVWLFPLIVPPPPLPPSSSRHPWGKVWPRAPSLTMTPPPSSPPSAAHLHPPEKAQYLCACMSIFFFKVKCIIVRGINANPPVVLLRRVSP